MSRENELNNVEDIFPLTPAQRLMLVHSAGSAGEDRLVNQLVYTVHGEVDRTAFREAWQGLSERHAALRTAFLWDGLPEPLQAVRETAGVPVAFADCGNEAEFEQLRIDDKGAGFRLIKAPLMRVTLATTAGRDPRMIWTFHSLVMDRWCFQAALDEWVALYESLASGEDPGDPPMAGEFASYVHWIHEQDEEATAAYWRDVLNGHRGATLVSQYGDADAAERSPRIARQELSIEQTAALHQLVRKSAITAGTLVQAATALALANLQGKESVVFGLSVPGRPPMLPEAEETVGSFINNVPTRVDCDPSQPILNWLRGLHGASSVRAHHEYASGAEICRWAHIPGAARLFDLLLIYAGHDLRGATGRTVQLDVSAGQPTLGSGDTPIFVIGSAGDQLRADFHYAPHLIAPQYAERLCAATADLLRAFADGLAGSVGDYTRALPPPAEVSQDHSVPLARMRGALTKPDSDLATQILLARQQVLGIGNRDLDADFFELGGNSLSAARFVERVEQLTGRPLGLGAVLEHRTISALAAFLASESADVQNPYIVEFRSGEHRPPLYFYEAEPAMHLAEHIPGGRAIYGLVTRQAISKPIEGSSLSAIAAEYAEQIRQVSPPERQIVIGGFCYGGALALEISRQLAESGWTPPAVLSLATRYTIPLRRYVPYLLFRRLPEWLRWFARSGGRGMRRGLISRLRSETSARLTRALPAKSGPGKLMTKNVAAQTAELTNAVVRHRPTPYHGPVIAVLGSNMSDDPRDPHFLSLRDVAAGELHVVTAPCRHDELTIPANAPFLAEVIEKYATTAKKEAARERPAAPREAVGAD